MAAGRIAFVLVFLLGAFLRLFRVDRQVLLDDEWHALNAVQDHDYAWIFSHLGHADHGIPLTLLYEWFSQGIGLGEMTMRAPSLLAGLLIIAVLPPLWKRWMGRGETLLFAGLLAISPFLVNYSRIARPYALLALLAGASVVLAWRWWRATERDRRASGLAWLACAALAAWINPVSLAVTAAPFLWFTGCASGSALRSRNFRPLLRLASMGAAVTAGVVALLYVPFSTDFGSLAARAGFHAVRAGTFAEALTLFSGSGYVPVAAIMAAAAVLGWFTLRRRDPEFAWYLLLIAAASTLAVALTGAAWILYGLVLARYLVGLLPVFLALAAMGLVAAWRQAAARFRLEGAGGAVLPAALLALFLAGPLPATDAGRSQFTHHMWHQFDYRASRNPIREALEWVEPEPFYAEIADRHPKGDAIVVEAPWWLESNWNPLPLYQAVHGQRVAVGFVGGVCAGDGLYGEIKRGAGIFDFDHFVFLQDVLDGTFPADYLVLRRKGPPGAREIPMDVERCETAARQSLGEPWRETDSALVFAL